MTSNERWLLPEGIVEVLPEQAAILEHMRRKVLDLYNSWGYVLVMPPFIEYLESLLVGTGNDLDLQTFKLIDQLNGRSMGIRADMTPQVARIDAHHLKSDLPTRLCYIGTVLHTRPDGFAGSRSPLQVGAELYGHQGIESDAEVLTLMIETLMTCGVTSPYLDIGHVGIFRGLAQQAGLSKEQEHELFDALQRKAKPEISDMLQGWALPNDISNMLNGLADLNGEVDVLAQAKQLFKAANKNVLTALAEIEQVAAITTKRFPDLALHYDLAELRGYHYHTGVVFAAYVPGQGQAIAQGGRYDGIGEVFGNARPATGFSSDLKTLLILGESTGNGRKLASILAPADDDEDLFQMVKRLRAEGECVICLLPGQKIDMQAIGCNRQLVKKKDQWQVETI